MFVDNNLQVDVKYYYVINAVDFSGNKGDFAAEVSFSITDVATEISGIPSDFALHQNYPNPFNPTTEIRFGVPENANVKIVIYNAVGKEVAQLVNKHFNAGYHTYTWNASNLASGVYFYEMTSNKFKQTQKMLLVK